jgi:hypothetical protein
LAGVEMGTADMFASSDEDPGCLSAGVGSLRLGDHSAGPIVPKNASGDAKPTDANRNSKDSTAVEYEYGYDVEMKMAWRRKLKAKSRQTEWCTQIRAPEGALDTDPCVAIFIAPDHTYAIPQLCVMDFHALNSGTDVPRATAVARKDVSKAFWTAKHTSDNQQISVVYKPDRDPGLYAIMKRGRQKLQINVTEAVAAEVAKNICIDIAKKYVKAELADTELYDERDRVFAEKGLPICSRKGRSFVF